MATTLATWHAAFRDLALTGVTNLDEPPVDFKTAVIPCKFVDSMGFDEAPLHRARIGGDQTMRCRVVVVTDVSGQDMRKNRWADALAMMDTLNTGIQTLGSTLGFGLRYSVECDPWFREGQAFAVVATVEGDVTGV